MSGLLHLVQRGGDGRGRSQFRPILAVPNVTAHPSTADVPITVLLYNGPLQCGFNVPIKGLTENKTMLHIYSRKYSIQAYYNFPCLIFPSECLGRHRDNELNVMLRRVRVLNGCFVITVYLLNLRRRIRIVVSRVTLTVGGQNPSGQKPPSSRTVHSTRRTHRDVV